MTGWSSRRGRCQTERGWLSVGARVWRGRRTAGGCRGQESEVSQEARSSQLEWCRCRALCARHGPNVVPCAETDQDTAATLICVNPAAFSKPTLTLAFLTLPLHFLVTRVNNRRMPKTLIVPKWQQNCEKLLVGIVPKKGAVTFHSQTFSSWKFVIKHV